MANSDNPRGFSPVRHMTGGVIRMNEYPIASGDSGDGTGIFSGDVLTLDTDGYADLAAVTEAVLGIFAGCHYTATDGSVVFSRQLPADTATLGAANIIAYVYDDPNIVFSAQVSGTGAFANNRGGFDIVIGTGSTTTGQSGAELDTTTLATSGQFMQLGLVPRDDNAWGANADVECKIFESVFSAALG